MALPGTSWLHQLTNSYARIWQPIVALCLYAGLYITFEWISFIHAMPIVGITLWNPPPACSLALLLTRGLWFAPALFVVGFAADGLVTGLPAGVVPALAANAMIAAGYTGVAFALGRVLRPKAVFWGIADVARFLFTVTLGVLVVALMAASALIVTHALSASRLLSAIGHFWIGDVTGILGILPAALTLSSARRYWSEATSARRMADTAVFLAGTAVSILLAFGLAGVQHLQFFYLLLLPIMWVAVRHGLASSAIAVMVLQSSMIGTAVSLGYPSNAFLALQLLSITISSTALVVGAIVTERQQAELNLRRKQSELDRVLRLSTASALGMAVVHQISQPLAVIAAYVHAARELVRSEPRQCENLEELLAKSEAECLRAGRVVDRLRDFLSGGNKHRSLVDLRLAVEELTATLADEAHRQGVDIRIDDSPPVSAIADRVQIEQILVNLIRNAIEAAAGGASPIKQVRVQLRCLANIVEVTVQDNGPGISDEVGERLFTPFESTKVTGMGLGLWLSREMVLEHGGRLWWEPSSPEGARFVVRLPQG